MSCECHEGGPLHAEALQRHCCEDSLTAMARERVVETVVDHYPAGKSQGQPDNSVGAGGGVDGQDGGLEDVG